MSGEQRSTKVYEITKRVEDMLDTFKRGGTDPSNAADRDRYAAEQSYLRRLVQRDMVRREWRSKVLFGVFTIFLGAGAAPTVSMFLRWMKWIQ
jgi:hypothetical protein